MATPFNTLAFVRKLTRAGVPSIQAEVQAEALAEVIDESVATKQDVKNLRRDIRELGMSLTIRFGSILAVAIGIVATLVKLL